MDMTHIQMSAHSLGHIGITNALNNPKEMASSTSFPVMYLFLADECIIYVYTAIWLELNVSFLIGTLPYVHCAISKWKFDLVREAALRMSE